MAETVTAVYDKPNGLALSPDGRELYVGDSGANHEPDSFDPMRPHSVTALRVRSVRIVAEDAAGNLSRTLRYP